MTDKLKIPRRSPIGPMNRRDFLRNMFFSAGAVGSAQMLAACGSSSQRLPGGTGDMPMGAG